VSASSRTLLHPAVIASEARQSHTLRRDCFGTVVPRNDRETNVTKGLNAGDVFHCGVMSDIIESRGIGIDGHGRTFEGVNRWVH